MKSILFILFFLFFSHALRAQSYDTLGSFHDVEIGIPVSQRWKLFASVEFRALAPGSRFYYSEWKGGAVYKLGYKSKITFAGGFYHHFEGGPKFENYKKKKEIKLWQQYNYKQALGVLDVSHRFRLEETVHKKFGLTLRYKLKGQIPINRKEIEPGTIYGLLANEISFRDRKGYFKRNRFHAGLGYVFTESFGLQAGWLRQLDYDVGLVRKKNYLFTTFKFTL